MDADEAHLRASWFEVSPLHFAVSAPGDPSLEVHASLAGAFGAQFLKHRGSLNTRKLTDYTNAQDDVAFLLGICGSAFAASVSEIADTLPGFIGYPLLAWNWLCGRETDYHPINPKIFDFRLGKGKDDEVRVRDAGMSLNFPLFPLLRRKCNVIIIKDSSAQNDGGCSGEQLLRAVKWFDNWKKYFEKDLDFFPDIATQLKGKLDPNGQLQPDVYRFHNKANTLHILFIPRLTNVDTLSFFLPLQERCNAVNDNTDLVLKLREKIKKELVEIAKSIPNKS
jgi:hypothetical protein